MRTQIQTQIRSLSSLLENLRDGTIQVPPFQREFVWSREQVRNLFDSISKSYPIGSILLWRPRGLHWEWKNNREVGSFILPDQKEPKSYVLDGCQRLSALFGCLNNPETSGLEFDETRRNEKFNLYFDLREEKFIFPQNGRVKPYQVPVYILTSTSEFRQYTRRVLEPSVSNTAELDLYLDRADTFSRALVDYKLAVIEIDGAELNDAVNIFSRINSKGTGISDDWMVNALSFGSDFNFSQEVERVISRLADYNFGNISRETIFRCYQSAFDDRLYIDTDIETLARRPGFSQTVTRMSDAIVKAVDFLYRELNVIDHRLLPYTAQLVFLSVYFLRAPYPDGRKTAELKRWFWITTYSNYFTASSLSVQRKAFAHFLEYIDGWFSDPVFDFESIRKKRTLPWPSKLSLSSARATALVLFQLDRISHSVEHLPIPRRLVIRRIFRDFDTIPANMAVTFSCLDGRQATEYCAPVASDAIFPDEIKLELTLRGAELRDMERKFVESLGLEYE